MIHLTALRLLVLFGVFCLAPDTLIYAQEKLLIFPLPQETEIFDGFFTLSESTSILIPDNASENDLALAGMLVREMSDKYGLALNITTAGVIPDSENVIIMGSIDNPLVKESCLNSNTVVTADSPGKEGYVLLVKENRILVAGWDEQGAFYGLQSLRQLMTSHVDFKIPQVRILYKPV